MALNNYLLRTLAENLLDRDYSIADQNLEFSQKLNQSSAFASHVNIGYNHGVIYIY